MTTSMQSTPVRSPVSTPPKPIGRFAVVKLWPGIKTAEDEVIARLKKAASALSLECVEISPHGEILGSGGLQASHLNCDFAIHLHFETPKAYDLFSFVALWNPVQFYHEWGYERFSANLLTHDDFLSCDSPEADDHVARMVSGLSTHLPPSLRLHHTLHDPILNPQLTNPTLFYIGINWERLGKSPSRYQQLLDMLDKTGTLKIYGPKLFQGVDVWSGYASYQHELPFDGASVVRAIAGCGVSLVLSSAAHKRAGLMSNRLFESLAAGAVIICDENPFARHHFGDALLYIDSRDPVEQQFRQVCEHLAWIKGNPVEASALAQRAQRIFQEHFLLEEQLSEIYRQLPARKAALSAHAHPSPTNYRRIRVFLLLDEEPARNFTERIASLEHQTATNFEVTIVLPDEEAERWKPMLTGLLAGTGLECTWLVVPPESRLPTSSLGRQILHCLQSLSSDDGVIFYAPNELIFSNHLEVLGAALQRSPESRVVATSVLLRHTPDGVKYFSDLMRDVPSLQYSANYPPGFARYLINAARIPQDLACILPYLHKLPLSPLFPETNVKALPTATVRIDIQKEYPKGAFEAERELAAIRDYTKYEYPGGATATPSNSAVALDVLAPTSLRIDRISRDDKIRLFAELLQATLPRWLTRPIFWSFLKLQRAKS